MGTLGLSLLSLLLLCLLNLFVMVALTVQKFLPLRTFLLLSQTQAVGGSRGLQREVTHPRPSGPVASEARPVLTPKKPLYSIQ